MQTPVLELALIGAGFQGEYVNRYLDPEDEGVRSMMT